MGTRTKQGAMPISFLIIHFRSGKFFDQIPFVPVEHDLNGVVVKIVGMRCKKGKKSFSIAFPLIGRKLLPSNVIYPQ
jgi:hypothetical protein